MGQRRVKIEVGATAEPVDLLGERAVFWPAAHTLIVADLHWGKDETFRAFGVPLPVGVLAADLARLSAAIECSGAQRLIVIGDLIHSKHGITPAVVAEVVAWREQHTALECFLVKGNHDRHLARLPEAWRIAVALDEIWREGPFAFVHEPAIVPGCFAWAGHLHPAVTLAGRGDAVRLSCFHIGANCGILPAFSEFTGGMSVPITATDRVFGVAENLVIPL